MRTTEIIKTLIAEIGMSNNDSLLEEMSNFFQRDNEIDLYKLNEDQKNAISEARQQVKDGHFFTND